MDTRTENALPTYVMDGGRERDRPRYRVEFPPPRGESPDQDEAYFYVAERERRTRIRFHDYAEIYKRPGLYEQLFYDRLKCQSPRKVADVLHRTVLRNNAHPAELRVLDLGAGNGMAAEALATAGVSRMVGVDIIEAARTAALRDRPGVYDHYYVADFCNLDEGLREDLRAWSFDCFVSVARWVSATYRPGPSRRRSTSSRTAGGSPSTSRRPSSTPATRAVLARWCVG